jgi:hypothetical protein
VTVDDPIERRLELECVFTIPGSVSPVTFRCGSSPVTDHGGWRWLRLSARLCNPMSDYERLAGAL